MRRPFQGGPDDPLEGSGWMPVGYPDGKGVSGVVGDQLGADVRLAQDQPSQSL
ncbi:MAG: hypothetical protein HKL82_04940 [Acidimicrobiaceae bacterium]|nr:hypothetical protein [Acidimicrobiaceae bacterium]